MLDPADFEVWRLYGNRGWPGRYLFDRTGALRDVHYGEGGYAETERAIAECLAELDEDFDRPGRRSSRCGPRTPRARCWSRRPPTSPCPPTATRLELVRDWIEGDDYIEAADAGARGDASRSHAGGAYAVLSGGDVEPGLYETDGTVTAESPGPPAARRPVHAAAAADRASPRWAARGRRAPCGSPWGA